MNPALIVDLYELTMACAYWREGLHDLATFELFVRTQPARRRFLVAAGIDEAVEGLTQLRFEESALAYLESLPGLSGDFLTWLGDLRFTGEVDAVAEGEVVFAGEPLVSVTAPIIEAQLVETWLLNVIGHRTTIASKAARVALAAGGRPFVDFSARRDQGPGAALAVAWASAVAGAAATSLVAAGPRFGLALSGTMAHSYVMAHDVEADAFDRFLDVFGSDSVLLIDTYDSVAAAHTVTELVRRRADRDGARPRAVRIDSGDLARTAKEVRAALDAGGCDDVGIFASGDLDEDAVAGLVAAGAPIDGFGVGTRMGTSADAPYLQAVYKLVEQAGAPRMKTSPGKATVPGRKQVRRLRENGRLAGDVVTRFDDHDSPGEAMLRPVVRDGRRIEPPATLDEARARCRDGLAALPDGLRSLAPSDAPPPVTLSRGLEALRAAAGATSGRARPRDAGQ